MTPDQWLDIAALWARVWPHRPLPPESIEPWFELLADLDGHDVRAALLAWAGDPDRSWPPQSPGELRDVALPRARDWTEAFTELSKLIRRHGRHGGRPELPEDLDAYVESMGGWTRVCLTFDASDSTTRAQFRDHHRTVTRRERRDQAYELARGMLPALNQGGTHNG